MNDEQKHSLLEEHVDLNYDIQWDLSGTTVQDILNCNADMTDQKFKDLYLGDWSVERVDGGDWKVVNSVVTPSDDSIAYVEPFEKTFNDIIADDITRAIDKCIINQLSDFAKDVDATTATISIPNYTVDIDLNEQECLAARNMLSVTLTPTNPINFCDISIVYKPTKSFLSAIKDLSDLTSEELDEAWDKLIDDIADQNFDDVPYIDTRDLTDGELDKFVEEGLDDEIIDTILDNKDQLRRVFRQTGSSQSDLDELDRVIQSAERVKGGNSTSTSSKSSRDAFDYAMDILK